MGKLSFFPNARTMFISVNQAVKFNFYIFAVWTVLILYKDIARAAWSDVSGNAVNITEHFGRILASFGATITYICYSGQGMSPKGQRSVLQTVILFIGLLLVNFYISRQKNGAGFNPNPAGLATLTAILFINEYAIWT